MLKLFIRQNAMRLLYDFFLAIGMSNSWKGSSAVDSSMFLLLRI